MSVLNVLRRTSPPLGANPYASDDLTGDVIDDEVVSEPRVAPNPFDRLPTQGFFNQPPRRSPYHTRRAQDQRDGALAWLGHDRITDALNILHVRDRFGRNPHGYAGVYEHNATTLAAALHMAACGLRVIDSHALNEDGTPTSRTANVKAPRGAKWGEEASSDHNKIIARWIGDGEYPPNKAGEVFAYAGRRQPRNVSIATGAGIMCLDIDLPDGPATLAALEAEHGVLPPTVEQTTGSGGRQFLFRLPPGVEIFNSAGAIGAGVDIRGEGGQMMAAPSVHPGFNFYRWREGRAPGQIEIAAAPEWLIAAARAASKKGGGEGKRATRPTKLGAAHGAERGNLAHVAAHEFDGWCAAMGDGEGRAGFDQPINYAAIAFARANKDRLTADRAALFDECVETLRAAILAAPCKDDRNRTRYAPDGYLRGRVCGAFEYTADEDEDEELRDHADEYLIDDDEDAPEVNDPETAADGALARRDWLPAPYRVAGGMIWTKPRKGSDESPVPVCQVFDVIGRASNLAGDGGAGRIIRFKNRNNIEVEFTYLLSEVAQERGGHVVEELAGADMHVAIEQPQGRARMLELLRQIHPAKVIATSPRAGWVADPGGIVQGFLLPTGGYVPAVRGTEYRLATTAKVRHTRTAGDLAGWQAAAKAALDQPENWHWTFGLAAGFVGPLLTLTGQPSGGVNISGDSSRGKSIALELAASIWATPAPPSGLLRVMNSTENAIEDYATIASSTFLGLDEIGAMQRPQTLMSSLFGLAAGAGKARKAGRGAGLAETAEFCVFGLLSNERSLRTTITNAGGDFRAGTVVRWADVDVNGCPDVNQSVIDQMHGIRSHYGHAGSAYVQYLIARGYHANAGEIAARIRAKIGALAPADQSTSQQRRTARLFALVAVAGDLAAEAGVLPLVGGTPASDRVMGAVRRAWAAFLASDEGAAASGDAALVAGFLSFVARNLGSRFVAPGEPARDVVGWHIKPGFTKADAPVQPEFVVVPLDQLSDLQKLGLSGTRSGLVQALRERDLLMLSGSNSIHTSLPKDCGGGKVPNLRVNWTLASGAGEAGAG